MKTSNGPSTTDLFGNTPASQRAFQVCLSYPCRKPTDVVPIDERLMAIARSVGRPSWDDGGYGGGQCDATLIFPTNKEAQAFVAAIRSADWSPLLNHAPVLGAVETHVELSPAAAVAQYVQQLYYEEQWNASDPKLDTAALTKVCERGIARDQESHEE